MKLSDGGWKKLMDRGAEEDRKTHERMRQEESHQDRMRGIQRRLGDEMATKTPEEQRKAAKRSQDAIGEAMERDERKGPRGGTWRGD